MNVLAAIVCFIFGGCIGAFIMALFKSSALASERERAEHAIKKANEYSEYKDKYEKLEKKYKKEKQKDKNNG